MIRIRQEVQRYLDKHFIVSEELLLWKVHLDICLLFNLTLDAAKSHIISWLSSKTEDSKFLKYEYPYEILNNIFIKCRSVRDSEDGLPTYVIGGDLKIFKIDPYCKLLHVDYTDVWAKISDILREVGGDFTIFDVDTIIVSWAEEKLKIFGYELRLMNYAKFIS